MNETEKDLLKLILDHLFRHEEWPRSSDFLRENFDQQADIEALREHGLLSPRSSVRNEISPLGLWQLRTDPRVRNVLDTADAIMLELRAIWLEHRGAGQVSTTADQLCSRANLELLLCRVALHYFCDDSIDYLSSPTPHSSGLGDGAKIPQDIHKAMPIRLALLDAQAGGVPEEYPDWVRFLAKCIDLRLTLDECSQALLDQRQVEGDPSAQDVSLSGGRVQVLVDHTRQIFNDEVIDDQLKDVSSQCGRIRAGTGDGPPIETLLSIVSWLRNVIVKKMPESLAEGGGNEYMAGKYYLHRVQQVHPGGGVRGAELASHLGKDESFAEAFSKRADLNGAVSYEGRARSRSESIFVLSDSASRDLERSLQSQALEAKGPPTTLSTGGGRIDRGDETAPQGGEPEGVGEQTMEQALRRRYQVFVSSTYRDLKEQREIVLREVVRLDCFPAGMEFFPGSDADPLEKVRGVIDESDLYILLTAYRYGTIPHGQEKSFTELEYEYAIERGMPLLWVPFSGVPNNHVREESLDAIFKLAEFKGRLERQQTPNHCSTEADLVSIVRSGVDGLVKKYEDQLVGRVRGSIRRRGGPR